MVIRKDHRLANKTEISVEDLCGLELICSEQSIKNDIPRWCGEKAERLTYSGSTNLFYNGSVFVKEGLGGMLTFEQLANTGSDSELCFIPLTPKHETKMFIIWKKYQIFTPAAEKLIEEIKKTAE